MHLDANSTERIKAEAANLGFSLFGVSHPSELEKTDRYKDWLEQGFHGNMSYLSRPDSISKRFSPSLLVKDCRSIISLGISYPLINYQESPHSKSNGWISSYAIYENYHTLLKILAEKLLKIIQKLSSGSHQLRVFTDSAPILEREFGVLGNLGWIGKNANLISSIVGSHFLLAEILTDIILDTNSNRNPDRCGKCQNCVDACPTQCIQPDRTIDARKCISYLTIENKGEIPLELRKKIGQWVFGCDICQTVCPWNYKSKNNEKIFRKSKIPASVELKEQLTFNETDFIQYYSGTPVLRASWLSFTRNLVVVSGNLQNHETLPPLIKLLKDHPSPMIRLHAAWALGRFGSDDSRSALVAGLKSEIEPSVLSEIHSALK